MSQDTVIGTDSVLNAILTKINGDIAELFSAVAALSGSAVLVSSNDSTPGFLIEKAVAGNAIDFTENNDGDDESLTIAFADDKDKEIEFRRFAYSIMFS